MPDERVAESAAEAREHRQRHLDLHAEHLPALDEILAEELPLLRRGDELGRSLDEEDPLLPRTVAEDERARLAPHREVEEPRRQAGRIEDAPIDGVRRQVRVPPERRARHEARELRVRAGRLEAPLLARDHALGPRLARREQLDEARKGDRADDDAVLLLHAVDARRDGPRLGRDAARGRRSAFALVAKHEPGAGVALELRGRGARLARLLLDVRPDDEVELLDEGRQARRPDLQAAAADDVLDGLGERARVWPAEHRIAGERAKEDRADVVRHATRRAIDRRDVGVADPHQDVELFAPAEERPQHDHLREHDADREEIAPSVELPPDHLLGRHVPELSLELTRVGAPLDLRRARDAEVGELHRARAIDEHVAGRHVAVNEGQRAPVVVARRVRVLEAAEHGECDVETDVERDVFAAGRSGADEPRARRAVDVLHRHVELAVLLPEVEHLDDVRMPEARANPGLVDEHGDEVRVAARTAARCA